MLPHIHKHNTHIHMEKDQYLVLKSQKVEPFGPSGQPKIVYYCCVLFGFGSGG